LKVPPRPRHLGSRNTERGAVVQRAKKLVELRPQSGLPPRRAGRGHRRRRL